MPKKNLTPDDIEENRRITVSVIANFRLEGLEPTTHSLALFDKIDKGELTTEEAIEIARKNALGTAADR